MCLIVLNCHLFVVVSLDTPVLPTKQWEEHLKLRTLVEKIREKQTGMICVDVLQFCCTILNSCLVKLIYEEDPILSGQPVLSVRSVNVSLKFIISEVDISELTRAL